MIKHPLSTLCGVAVLAASLADAQDDSWRKARPASDFLFHMSAEAITASTQLTDEEAMVALREAASLSAAGNEQRDAFLRAVGRASRLFASVECGTIFGEGTIVPITLNRHQAGFDGVRVLLPATPRKHLTLFYAVPTGARVNAPGLYPVSRSGIAMYFEAAPTAATTTPWTVNYSAYIGRRPGESSLPGAEYILTFSISGTQSIPGFVGVGCFNSEEDATGTLSNSRTRNDPVMLARAHLAFFGIQCRTDPGQQLAMGINAASPATIAAALAAGASMNDTPVLWQVLNRHEGETPFHLVPYYLKQGANPNAAGPDGQYPLHRICRYGFGFTGQLKEWMDREMAEIAQQLVKAGAEINATDRGGKTPLMIVAGGFAPNPVTVWTLLRLGADPTLKDASGKTALDLVTKGNEKFIRPLLERVTP